MQTLTENYSQKETKERNETKVRQTYSIHLQLTLTYTRNDADVVLIFSFLVFRFFLPTFGIGEKNLN